MIQQREFLIQEISALKCRIICSILLFLLAFVVQLVAIVKSTISDSPLSAACSILIVITTIAAVIAGAFASKLSTTLANLTNVVDGILEYSADTNNDLYRANLIVSALLLPAVEVNAKSANMELGEFLMKYQLCPFERQVVQTPSEMISIGVQANRSSIVV